MESETVRDGWKLVTFRHLWLQWMGYFIDGSCEKIRFWTILFIYGWHFGLIFSRNWIEVTEHGTLETFGIRNLQRFGQYVCGDLVNVENDKFKCWFYIILTLTTISEISDCWRVMQLSFYGHLIVTVYNIAIKPIADEIINKFVCLIISNTFGVNLKRLRRQIFSLTNLMWN